MRLVTVDPLNPAPVPVPAVPQPVAPPKPKRGSKARNVRGMVEVRVAGIPCYADPTSVHIQKPQGRYADSDWDCYGYEEVEFDLYDRKGYRAVWLEKKMDKEDADKIVQAILNNC